MVAPHSPSLPVLSTQALHRAAAAARSREEARHDAGLVDRFNTGDERAFVEIVERHRARMLQIALRLLRNHADAEEIAQDTFVRAHRGLAKFRGDSSLAAWLHRITLNLARNRYWYFFRRHRQSTLSLDSAVGDHGPATIADLVAGDTPDPVHEALAGEFAEIVTGCMSRLNPGQREILLLRNVRQQTYREIARRLGINVGTVKSRVARARENLRLLLAPYYADRAESGAVSERPWFESERPAGLLRRAGN